MAENDATKEPEQDKAPAASGAPIGQSIPPAFHQTVIRAEAQQLEKGLGIGASIVPADLDQEVLADASATAHIPIEEVSRQGHRVVFDENGDFNKGPVSSGGAYEVIRVLGRGGMGVVCAARQESLQREVALKIARKTSSGNEGTTRADLEMFTNEAYVTGNLDHPNVVPVHTLAQDNSGRLFFTMKQVSGICWEHLLSPALVRNRAERKKVEERSRKMSLEEHLDILLKVSDALAYAHDKGFLHRDIKPENVMIGSYGEVLLMDWGLAMKYGDRNPYVLDPSLTAQLVGTPAYLAPEMARGKMTRFGPATDIYLLGASLYRVITGRPPHWGEGVVGAVNKAASGLIDPPEEIAKNKVIDPEISRITLKALSKSMKKRYQTVKEFQADLRQYLAHDEARAVARNAADMLSQIRDLVVSGGDQAGAEADRPALLKLDKQGAAEVYGRMSVCIGAYLQSINLWPENEDALKGALAVIRLQIRLALRQGDLTLARSRIELLDSVSPESAPDKWAQSIKGIQKRLVTDLKARETRQAAIEKRQRFQRSLVLVIISLLLVGVAGTLHLMIKQKSMVLDHLRTTEERNQLSQDSLRLAESLRLRSFAQAVSARAALVDRYLIDLRNVVDLYRREADRLLALPPDMLAPMARTPAGRDGYYLDSDYYSPLTSPKDMHTHPQHKVEMSLSQSTFKLAPWAQKGPKHNAALASATWLVRLGVIFAHVHQSRSDALYSVAGTSTGVLMSFPGSGRFRPKPEYDPTKRPWYLAATEGARTGREEAHWAEPHVDAGGKGLLLTCVSAIRKGDKVMGVVGLEVSMATLKRFLVEHAEQISKQTRGLLVREDGRILVDTNYVADPSSWDKHFKLATMDDLDPDLANYIRGAQSGQIDDSKALKVKTGSGPTLFSHSKLPHIGWLLVVTTPWQEK